MGLTLGAASSLEEADLDAGGALKLLVSETVAYCLARKDWPDRSLVTISWPPRPRGIRGRIMLALFANGAEEERMGGRGYRLLNHRIRRAEMVEEGRPRANWLVRARDRSTMVVSGL